jgi:hypothetical protein
MAEARSSLPALGRRTAELRLQCNQVAREMDAHALDERYDGCAAELRRLVEEYRLTLRRLTDARTILSRVQPGRLSPGHPISAVIEVTDTVRPGVTVVFGQFSETITAPLRRPCFCLRGGRIAR